MNPLHGLADAIAHAPQPVALDPAACQLFDRLCNKVNAACTQSWLYRLILLPVSCLAMRDISCTAEAVGSRVAQAAMRRVFPPR